MVKFFYIAFIVILIQESASGQVAHATISATITTPVGAEISGDISFEKFTSSNKSTKKGVEAESSEKILPIRIIGESFAHTVTIENEIIENATVLLKRKKDIKEGYPSNRTYGPLTTITVNFD